jgi:hypothetical protein
MGPQVDSLVPGSVEILYSDPPWGDPLLKYFATATERATGARPEQPRYVDLCQRYADLIATRVTEYVFIEVGKASAPPMLEAVAPLLKEPAVVPFWYGSNTEAALIYGRRGDGPNAPIGDLHGLKGLPFVKHLLSGVARPGWTVLDPCCGAGYTARAAASLGMVFRGNELNPARLAKTEKYLRKMTGTA